jgi:hypothetical protein
MLSASCTLPPSNAISADCTVRTGISCRKKCAFAEEFLNETAGIFTKKKRIG